MDNPVTISAILPSSSRRFWQLLLSISLLGGCSSLYYDTMEKLGYEKRDILVDPRK